MSLSRKRQKELSRLRGNAQDLWHAQQDVLDRANSIAREAGRQAGHLTREEVAPRVRDSYATYVQPGLDRGAYYSRRLARGAGDVVNNNIVPAFGTVLGTALSVADVANDARVQAAVRRLSPRRAPVVVKKSGPGFGTVLAIGVGAVALAGVAYAVWQTFRADDELWVADDDAPVTLTDTTE
ncbi:MAG: hypothetical protein ABI310_10765 [Microbacteriaceae bacterium]